MGSYLPKQILSNQDLEKMVETSDEWIVSRTGMKERRIAAKDEFPSDMGAIAAEKALADAKIAPSDIELIIVMTMTPDHISPSTAALIQAKLAATKAAAMDVQAACSGFIYGLSLSKAYIESGLYKNVLLIASEKMSAFMDYTDRSTCVLFGDGASAAFITAEGAGLAIDTVCLGADGTMPDLLHIPAGGSRNPASVDTLKDRGHYFKMKGSETFKHAVRRMASAAKECMAKANLQENEISWLIPHQANLRIIEAMGKSFNIPEAKVYKTIHKYGNTSASSIAIAVEELCQIHEIKTGEHLLLTAFGAGLTWGAAILTKITG